MNTSVLILSILTIAVLPPAHSQSNITETSSTSLNASASNKQLLSDEEFQTLAIIAQIAQNITYNTRAIENSLGRTIVRTLYDLQPIMIDLSKNKIELANEDYTNFAPHLTLEEEGYSITFGDILFRKSYEQSELSASTQINCVFSDLLQVTIPIEGNDIEFSGSVNISKVTEKTSILTDFSITFNNLRVLVTTRTNHTAYQKLQNNQSQFEILYDNSNIDVNAQPGYESITTKALSTLIPVIRSHIKAKITPQFANILSQNICFAKLSAYCMQPLKLISKPDQSKEHLYFHTRYKEVNLQNYSLSLDIYQMSIDGMLNISDVRLTKNIDNITFSILIEDIKGELDWAYYNPHLYENVRPKKSNFTIGSINITGTLFVGIISDVDLLFKSFVIPSTSDNPIASFGSQILMHEFKNIIQAKVNFAIQNGVFEEVKVITDQLNAMSTKELAESTKHLQAANDAKKTFINAQAIILKYHFNDTIYPILK